MSACAQSPHNVTVLLQTGKCFVLACNLSNSAADYEQLTAMKDILSVTCEDTGIESKVQARGPNQLQTARQVSNFWLMTVKDGCNVLSLQGISGATKAGSLLWHYGGDGGCKGLWWWCGGV